MTDQATIRKGSRWHVAGLIACLIALAVLPGIRMSGAVETLVNAGVLILLVAFIWRILSRRKAEQDARRLPRSRKPILILGLIAAGGVLLYLGLMIDFDLEARHQPLFQQAMGISRRSEVVRSYLGNRFRVGWPIDENSTESHTSGNATLAIPVSGDRAKGTLFVIGSKSAGEWSIQEIFLVLSGERTRHSIALQGNIPRAAQ